MMAEMPDAAAPRWPNGWSTERYLSLPQRDARIDTCACGVKKGFLENVNGDIQDVLVCDVCDEPLKGST